MLRIKQKVILSNKSDLFSLSDENGKQKIEHLKKELTMDKSF